MGDCDFRYFGYRLPNNRVVFLTNRPDACVPDQVVEFLKKYSPQVRFMFTDDYVEVTPNEFYPAPHFHWYCWVPGRNPTVEDIWTVLVLMSRYDKNTNPHRPIWMHCDSSTMRAPTFFGLYLHAAYPDKVQEICAPVREAEKEAGGRLWGHPDAYAGYVLKEDEGHYQPEVAELIKAWQEGGENKAYQYMMNELDSRINRHRKES